MSPLEHFLGLFLNTLWKEGERLAKIKVLSLSLQGFRSLRAVSRLYFFAVLASTSFTAALFSGVIYGVTTYSHTGFVPVDWFTGGMLLIALVSLGVPLFALREKTWLRALGVQQQLNALAPERESRHEPTTQDLKTMLIPIIQEVLEEAIATSRQEGNARPHIAKAAKPKAPPARSTRPTAGAKHFHL